MRHVTGHPATPAVSIVLPTYNRLAYLREAVASVRMQTVADWELIVVDDGSTDDSVVWLESLGDARIVVVPRPHTGHKSELRNAGLARARAAWIAFLDSDDRWTPAKLERQLAFHAAHPTVRWSYTGRTFIDDRGEPIPSERFKQWTPHTGRILREVIELEANIALPSVMAARSLLGEAGDFNEAWRSAEDYELWLRLAERAEIGLVDEPLLEVRKHRAILTQRPDVSLGLSAMLRSFAARSADAELRALARRRGAYHAVEAADQLASRGEWAAARGALALAIVAKPASPFAYRAVGRYLWRRMRAPFTRSTAPAA
jgi:glycosyltransferase involved in cell wall biosynthesis